jgi:hypothetical protein
MTPRRRSTLYVMCLGSALLVTVIGVSAVTAVRVRQNAVLDTQGTIAARYLAQSAVELAIAEIENNPNWREDNADGWWVVSLPCGNGQVSVNVSGNGQVSVNVSDPDDSDLADHICDAVRVTGYGFAGDACQIMRVALDSDAIGVDELPETIEKLGPLSYWRLGDASTTTALDEYGGHDGTLHNGAALDGGSPFRCNTAAVFDGANDFIEIPHHKAFEIDQGTICFWFYTEDAAREQGLIAKNAAGRGNGGHLEVYLTGGAPRVLLQSTSTDYYLWSGNIQSRQWYFIAVCFGPSGMRLYVNDVYMDGNSYPGGLGDSSQSAAKLVADPGNTEPLAIGVRTHLTAEGSLVGWDRPLEGMIDELAIYTRVLSTDELNTIYNKGAKLAPHTMSPALKSWRQMTQ